jgi:DNA polymerase III delta subunit
VKYYDFVDKQPAIDALVVIEGGEEPLFAQRAIDAILERLLPPDVRALNADLFDGLEGDAIGQRVGDAINAMPFLAERRVVVVRNCHRMRAQPRRDLWAAAATAPPGNTLVLEDPAPASRKSTKSATKSDPSESGGSKAGSFGPLAGRRALRIETTVNQDVRERFVDETLARLGAKADPDVIGVLARTTSDLGSIENDLEKLALKGTRITLADLERESLIADDAKAWHYAQALVEGRPAEALAIAFELLANDARGAVPLASALASDFALLWELARPGGAPLTGRNTWREGRLRPIARRIGERRARLGYEAAVRGFEAVVTGRIDDHRSMIELLTADLAARLAPSR